LGRRTVTAGIGFHSWTCAAATAASCVAHLWLVAENQHGTWLNVLMLAMVAVCLPCVVHIWRHRRDGDLRLASAVRRVMAAALAMTGVHAVLLLGGAGGLGHHHGAVAGTAPPGSGALLEVIALEITTALLAATLLARLRAQPATAQAEPAGARMNRVSR
jgi:hypothetical protein